MLFSYIKSFFISEIINTPPFLTILSFILEKYHLYKYLWNYLKVRYVKGIDKNDIPPTK